MVGAKHSANVLGVDIKDRGLLVETALNNYISPLDGLLVHCWYAPPPEPDFVRML